MDLIFGIATLLAFGFTIYVYYKFKYPGRITCYVDKRTPLLHTIVDSFEDVSIYYKSNPINHQLIIFRFFLVNTGKKDISSEMIRVPITLDFEKDVLILDAKVTPDNPNIKIERDIIINKQLLISFDSLLVSESIKIELLVEDRSFGKTLGKKDNSISSADFKFNHRILGTSKIKTEPIPELEEFKSKNKYVKNYLTAGITIILLIASFFIPVSEKPSNQSSLSLLYKTEINDTLKSWIELKPFDDNSILIENESFNFRRVLNKDTLISLLDNTNFKIEPKIKIDLSAKGVIYFLDFLLVIVFYMNILEIIKILGLKIFLQLLIYYCQTLQTLLLISFSYELELNSFYKMNFEYLRNY